MTMESNRIPIGRCADCPFVSSCWASCCVSRPHPSRRSVRFGAWLINGMGKSIKTRSRLLSKLSDGATNQETGVNLGLYPTLSNLVCVCGGTGDGGLKWCRGPDPVETGILPT